MTHKYVWPACIAAAAHGALLFGVPKSVRPAPPREPPEVVGCWLHPPPVADEVVEVAAREPDEPSVRAEPAAPGERVDPTPAGPPAIMAPPDVPAILPGDWPRIGVRPLTLPDGPGIGPGGGEVFGGGALDRPPRTRFQASPLYPPSARREGRTGAVTVEFLVDESGLVVDPRIATSSDPEFEEAALRAVAQWRFEPGRRHGRVVRFRMSVPIHFSLNE